MGILNGTSAFLGEFFSMSRIVLRKAQEGIYCLLVVLVALDLNYHLLQPKDDLLAALPRHLVTHKVPRAFPMLPRTLFMLVRDILRHTVSQVPSTSASTACEINATRRAV